LESQRFEWDDRKAVANLRKHKIGFEEAATIFDDPFVIIKVDPAHSIQEFRAVPEFMCPFSGMRKAAYS